MVSTRDRPFYSIKPPKPNVSNRIARYLAQNRTQTIIILQLAENHPIDYRS